MEGGVVEVRLQNLSGGIKKGGSGPPRENLFPGYGCGGPYGGPPAGALVPPFFLRTKGRTHAHTHKLHPEERNPQIMQIAEAVGEEATKDLERERVDLRSWGEKKKAMAGERPSIPVNKLGLEGGFGERGGTTLYGEREKDSSLRERD